MEQLIKRNTELEKTNEKLLIQIQELSHNSQLTVGVDRRKISLRPSACPSCGCDVIWKNGTYDRKDGQVQRMRHQDLHGGKKNSRITGEEDLIVQIERANIVFNGNKFPAGCFNQEESTLHLSQVEFLQETGSSGFRLCYYHQLHLQIEPNALHYQYRQVKPTPLNSW